jgi:hypothetical protein
MYQMIKKDTILKALEAKGPMIPVHLKREVAASDTIILGAILSELVGEGKVKISSTKIGGSPAYYVPGTEARLVNLIKHLNEKDRRTVELLEQKKVLKDSEQTPLVRVSLRNIKDYAKPLEVNLKAGKELYWKWFIIPAEEAEQIIMKLEKLVKAPELKKEEEVIAKPLPKAVVEEKPVSVAPKPIEKKPVIAVPKERKEQKKPEPVAVEVQKQLPKQAVILGDEKNAFLKQIKEFFGKNEIVLLELKFAKKSEAEMIVSVPSRIGSQEYYCRAKSKKKLNDSDLSSAYIQGQATKLPVLLLITGELNKKAKEMLTKEFKGMLVKAI